MGHMKYGTVVTDANVYQEANKDIRPYIDSMIDELLLEGSGIDGADHLVELYAKARDGASCLLLLEHYSNFDLPVFNYLIRRDLPSGSALADDIVAIAGLKLNQDNPVVAAFTEAYSRIVIYPSRSLKGLDPEKDRAEISRSNAINRAAMKTLNDIKKRGKPVLVFPSGTRFRPWDPESKKGVREIDSYIKTFDYLCLIAVNGSVLRIQRGDMAEDTVCPDKVVFTVGEALPCSAFRDRARNATSENEDKKQAVADDIMAQLEAMHREAEKKRQTTNRSDSVKNA